MVFSSIIFICIFLPIFLFCYFLTKNVNYRNIILVIFSLFFYAWGEPLWILALIFSGTLDYVNGIIINKYFGRWEAKLALISSLVLNLGLLALFKYSGFIVENINAFFHISLNFPKFNLPLGISFYTFQTLSYTIDVYRGEVTYQKSYIKFMSYVTMFPQLVAGPIVRYIDIHTNLDNRAITVNKFSDGVTRFACGLGKKVILANSAGAIVEQLLAGDLARLSTLSAWLGIVMYTFQIYFDFSGYSDMAIGMGKMIGFDFKENFNYPYMSKSITEFWRRWHISLSSFFRDYVYIPLGGNRKNQLFNISIVWILTGIWHGASWNFILWGVYYGIILIIEKVFLGNLLKKLPSVIGHAYSLIAIVFGWMLFYFTDMTKLVKFLKICLYPQSGRYFYDYTFFSVFINHIFLLVVLILASTPYPLKLFKLVIRNFSQLKYLENAYSFLLVFICFALLLGQTYNPFLYFRF